MNNENSHAFSNKDIKPYWDHRFQRHAIKLLPGDFYATNQDEIIVTVLGSCISVCLYDTVIKAGGMNHFMLPKSKVTSETETSSLVFQDNQMARYGNVAMELLINALIKLGGNRMNMIAKVFGGGQVTDSSIDVGKNNIEFAREYLKLEGIPVLKSDVGGLNPRKIYYIPSLNEVYVKLIQRINNNTILSREQDYQLQLETRVTDNNIFFLEG